MNKYLKIGDKIIWRGGWGTDDPQEAVVDNIEINVHPTTKDGEEVNKVEWDLVDETVIVTLDNGHWAYGNQVERYKVPTIL